MPSINVFIEVTELLEILCFDICSFAILLILLFSIGFRKTMNDEAGKKLLKLVLATMAATAFDVIANYNNGRGDVSTLNYVSSGLFFIARNAAYYMYVSYIVVITGTWHKLGNVVIELLRFIPFTITAAIAASAPYTKLFYYYDANNYYVRGEAIGAIYICNAIYCIYAMYYIIKNFTLMGFQKMISLASCALFSFIAAIIQYEYPYLIIDIIGFTLSLLFIVLFIDNPGDKTDSTSMLLNYQTYIKELKKVFFTKRPVDIIHINITNHKMIEEILSYSNYIIFIKTLSNQLQEDNEYTRSAGEMFYLKNGSFRILLPDNDDNRTAALSRRVLRNFNTEIDVNGTVISVEASVCITSCPKDFDYLDALLDFGTVAHSFEKPGEIVYSKDLLGTDAYNMHVNMKRQVEQGLINGRFELFYQPVYDVTAEKYTGIETHLRLHDEDEHILESDLFLPVAEQSGAIIEIGNFVMDEVCKLVSSKEFDKLGIQRVGIKLSVAQCLQNDLPQQVFKAIEKYDVNPKKLMFEIKESLTSDNQRIFIENIRYLAQEGVVFALNDYGTGYSNISTLSTLPIEVVKFDKAFATSEESLKIRAIFENSVEMVKELGKLVTIDGADTAKDAERFSKLNCDFLLGDHYGKPMTRDRLLEFFEQQAFFEGQIKAKNGNN